MSEEVKLISLFWSDLLNNEQCLLEAMEDLHFCRFHHENYGFSFPLVPCTSSSTYTNPRQLEQRGGIYK